MMLRIAAAAFIAGISTASAQDLGTWCLPGFGCKPVTCELIRWGAATLPQSMLDEYKGKASPQQIAAGRACLGLPPESKYGRKIK